MKRILFVCSGNTCRSPLAEGIARRLLAERDACDVGSAGSSAVDGARASENSVEVARRHGIDISAHRARLLSATLVRNADLIVTMTDMHRRTVGVIEPDALAYTRLLTDFCDDSGDIPDPIGGGLEHYSKTYDVIARCVESMVSSLDDFDGWRRDGGETS